MATPCVLRSALVRVLTSDASAASMMTDSGGSIDDTGDAADVDGASAADGTFHGVS